ncbi:PrgI family protein [Catenulispora sp. NL8]|uniref:PrgI family protein n=1 Tax=Catenulispora pinistramenti TaxID=2705254 RepID=A0ABS5KN33_9ACTN|nr:MULTISPECIES: PrgI family protein [Catenulispora]MBS2547419.1 PrgI family protein [Catenulispora pinistramenti]
MTQDYGTARIPQDVSQPDKIMFGATARQCVILGGTTAGLWLLWLALRSSVPPLMFAAPAGLLLVLLGIAVTAERDGMSVDQLLFAAIRQALSPKRRVMAPEGVEDPPAFVSGLFQGNAPKTPASLGLPVRQLRDDGAVDLGPDGCAALASASTVNFALRTQGEQALLISGFGRWLNSLTGPVQITSRTTPADLGKQINTLRDSAPRLPHPLLEAAAQNHADFLADINASGSVLHRSLLVTARELDPKHAPRAARRIAETAALSASEIDAVPLDSIAAQLALSAALDPDYR